jgi:pimeloyl-ACP methyl ester carboxylesterase
MILTLPIRGQNKAKDGKVFWNSVMRRTHMRTVTSRDGTTIAFDQSGQGPALILVGGTLEQRALDTDTAKLAAFPLLSQHFTVFHYDRRGRGDSTDTQPYAVVREIEDLGAIINEAGGSAFVSGISAGAALALEAALQLGDKIEKLALYEAPYGDDPAYRQAAKEFKKQVNLALTEGRRGDAVALFIMFLGGTAEQLDEIRQLPMWPMWEAVAPTLAYEMEIAGEDPAVPTQRAVNVAVPALVMAGAESDPSAHITAKALAKAIPHATYRSLEGQGHEVAPEALAPVLIEFFKGSGNATVKGK